MRPAFQKGRLQACLQLQSPCDAIAILFGLPSREHVAPLVLLCLRVQHKACAWFTAALKFRVSEA